MEGERLFVIPINEMIKFSVALQLKFPYISKKKRGGGGGGADL